MQTHTHRAHWPSQLRCTTSLHLENEKEERAKALQKEASVKVLEVMNLKESATSCTSGHR